MLVFNKLDRLEANQRPRVRVDMIERSGGERVPRVFVSALDGEGLDDLRRVISEIFLATENSTAESDSRLNTDEETSIDEAADEGDHVGVLQRPTGT